MTRDHFPDRDAFRILPPSPPAMPVLCSTWPECGCDGECDKQRAERIEHLLFRRRGVDVPVAILLTAIVALAAFAIFGI